MSAETYVALTPASLSARLGDLAVLRERVGPPEGWQVREVGDGNLNLVFIVTGAAGQAVVKQALPYVRLVGESWPLPLKRSFFEYNALIRQAARDPGSVPAVWHFDEAQAIVVMEYLTPHVILRHALIEGRRVAGLGERLGEFCARTLFRGSDLSMPAAAKKADLALFAGNVELCDITENLVFSDPYFAAPMNRHTPGLDGIVARLRGDLSLKVAAQHLKMAFTSRGETLLHGDLHTGSIMVTDTETRVIDPEFATYGPMGFDVGMLIANFLMAHFSQPGHESAPGDRAEHQGWLLSVLETLWRSFAAEFGHLWRTERRGILYQASLYEDQGHGLASEQALADLLGRIWTDALGFCGIEMHRRILGLAHNADFERIADEGRRAACEARALAMGRQLMLGACAIRGIDAVTAMARRMDKEDHL
ncbi:S-methyl-5-thioribose kinase [Rhodobacter calidifons]|uniref:S-methyl-5-thioribose kinase n=1 Tax=Rhodobacter calidifons TaxID=2715277 RepID=A0ABX0G1J9_9RHOB|nr:S-methyl-5-thioribose kinase [Rhodobacter calidifons]NHB75152.1 S-methyl-5-thioribose kinase [Rhodobacter calidifons]